MKRFRSRLDGLQRLREQQEQLARVRVAGCQQQLQEIEQELAAARQQLQVTSASVNHLLSGHPGAETVAGSLALFQRQQQDIALAAQKQVQAAEAVQTALSDWNDARAELKAITQRIENQRAEHRRHGFLQEEHAQQETASQAFFHRGAGRGE